jgi:hypothetical protein
MRNRLIVTVLMIFLSVAPVFAGHSVAGYGYCECDNPGSHETQKSSVEDDTKYSENTDTSDLELLLNSLSILLRVSL